MELFSIWGVSSLPYVQVVSSEHWAVPSFWGHHLAALPVYVARNLGSGSPLAQKVPWRSKASFHELAFGHCRDFPDKSLGTPCFFKHTGKNMSGLLLALACLFRTKENRRSFSNVEQSWYPMALPYFRTLYVVGWYYTPTCFPLLKILQELRGLVWIGI